MVLQHGHLRITQKLKGINLQTWASYSEVLAGLVSVGDCSRSVRFCATRPVTPNCQPDRLYRKQACKESHGPRLACSAQLRALSPELVCMTFSSMV